MKIASSDIILSSQHASVEKHSLRESLRAWVGAERPDFEGRGRAPNRPAVDRVSISEQGKAAQKSDAVSDTQEAVDNDPRMQLLISMVEAMTGRKIRILSMKELQPSETPQEPLQDPNATAKQAAPQPAARPDADDRLLDVVEIACRSLAGIQEHLDAVAHVVLEHELPGQDRAPDGDSTQYQRVAQAQQRTDMQSLIALVKAGYKIKIQPNAIEGR